MLRLALPIRLVAFAVVGLSYERCAPIVKSQPFSDTGSPGHQQITVKIRNGKTGLPIWLASPYVFLGNKTGPEDFRESYRRTKLWGDAKVDVSGIYPREVGVWVDFIDRDCRYPAGNPRGIGAYDLDKILATGIVVPNLCSSKTQRPEPGVLTLYVIPSTFKEIWDE